MELTHEISATFEGAVALDHKMHFSESVMPQLSAAFPISWSTQGCPRNADDVSEAYWMGLLSKEGARAFELHARKCPRCREMSEQAHEFVSELTHAGHAMAAA